MKSFFVLATFIFVLTSSLFAQMSLKGKVVDASTGKPLIGASVRLVGTNVGIATSNQGEFVLSNVSGGEYSLRASYAGYQSATIKVDRSSENIIFQLEVSPVNLNQVVVTGTGTHRRLKDSPVPIEVMTAADIQKAGVATFEDAMLMLNPSFDIRPTAMGSNITLNGLTNKHILILVNGKKMMGDISGNVDLSRIDMKRVKRIEILKGAASSLYGSDAIAGVINIITDQPHDKLNVTSYTRFGGKNSFIQNVVADVNAGKFSSSTSYQRRQADGWRLSDINQDSTDTRKTVSDEFHSNIFNQGFAYGFNKSFSTYVEGSYFDKRIKRPVNVDDKDKTAFDYDIEYEDYSFGLGGKYLLNRNSYLSMDWFISNYEYSYIYTRETKSNELGEEVLTKRQRYLNGNLKGVFQLGKYNKLSAGTEFVQDYLKNPESLEEAKTANTFALFAQDEIRLFDNFQILPGLRYVHHETFKSRLTPKISLMYNRNNFNFRGTYAAGFKTPRLEELFYYKEKGSTITVGNKDLKPESSNYYSLNVEYLGRYLSVSVDGYINDVKNIISKESLTPSAEEKENGFSKKDLYVNVEKARIKGIDVSFTSYLGYGFALGGGYSYVDPKDRIEKVQLGGTVRSTGTVKASWMHDWNHYLLNVSLNGRIQGKKFFGEDDEAVKYDIWNLTTNHKFAPVGKFLFELNAGVENLFDFVDDRPYGSRYANISPGRTFFAGLTIRFKM